HCAVECRIEKPDLPPEPFAGLLVEPGRPPLQLSVPVRPVAPKPQPHPQWRAGLDALARRERPEHAHVAQLGEPLGDQLLDSVLRRADHVYASAERSPININADPVVTAGVFLKARWGVICALMDAPIVSVLILAVAQPAADNQELRFCLKHSELLGQLVNIAD